MTRALLALVAAFGLRYPCQAMNARGERILIFGDSLTQHVGGGSPVWNVDQGSQRQHSGPGDLLASLLLEQGAEAVRTNALVSRSAFNFWTRETAQNLIAADLAWRPTKIVFVLGTNDVGLTPGPDEAAFIRLRDAYKPAKAEMWAIGPFKSRLSPAGIDQVTATLRKVFGSRVIDGRTLSTMISNGPDGVHYEPTGARMLALNMADALLSASPIKPWMGLAIGAAVVVGGALAYSFWTRSGALHGLEIVDGKRWGGSVNELIRGGHRQVPCKSGLDRSGNVRCWSRGLGGSDDVHEGLAVYLEPPSKVPGIGRERGKRPASGIGRFKSAHGSVRYVLYEAGEPVAALQVVSLDGKQATVANVYTRPDQRRKGLAARLLARARQDFEHVEHATEINLSPAGRAWARALGASELPPGGVHLIEEAAEAVGRAGRFGSHKVFIGDLYDEVRRRGIDISLDDFKRELARLRRSGDITLARADLVAAMDPKRVARAELHDDHATYHFVVLDR